MQTGTAAKLSLLLQRNTMFLKVFTGVLLGLATSFVSCSGLPPLSSSGSPAGFATTDAESARQRVGEVNDLQLSVFQLNDAVDGSDDVIVFGEDGETALGSLSLDRGRTNSAQHQKGRTIHVSDTTSSTSTNRWWPNFGGNNTTNKPCSSHQSCTECSQSSRFCHWCEKDLACHPIGSPYGCVKGSTCEKKESGSGAEEQNKTASNSCSSHKSCTECSQSSSFCHWCEKDSTCHPIGSPYGCFKGSTCEKKESGSSAAEQNKTASNSCSSHKSCTECSESSRFCHWCEKDSACHPIGSLYGCFKGATCEKSKDGASSGKDGKKKSSAGKKSSTAKKSCSDHMTCTECSLSSHLCHWCEHDAACHALGSWHGCLMGVNCYSNGRCQRDEPQRVRQMVFTYIPGWILAIILLIGLSMICCASLCFAAAGAAKDAYDNLRIITNHSALDRGTWNVADEVDKENSVLLILDTEGAGESDTERGRSHSIQMTESFASRGLIPQGDEVGDHLGGDGEDCVDGVSHSSGYSMLLDNNKDEHNDSESFLPQRSLRTAPSVSRQAGCFLNTCKGFYIATIIVVVLCVITTVAYFPKAPELNMCSNSVAWKKIVDGLTSLKLAADLKLLMSVYNPNHLDLVLDSVSGHFDHDGSQVGTFSVPPSDIKSQSITDILVDTTFAPDKWQALALSAEYYKGTLKLELGLKVKGRIPSLWNYSFAHTVDNLLIHVDDPKFRNRHLCACPSWNDVTGHNSTELR